MKALKSVLLEQRIEIDELKAQITYLNHGGHSPKLLAECKQELAEAVKYYISAKKYVDSMRKYAA